MIRFDVLVCLVGATALAGCSEDTSTARPRDAGTSGGGGKAGTGGFSASGGGGSGGGGTAGATSGGSGGSGGTVEPPSLSRIGETFEVPTLASSTPKRFADVAYDAARDVYLVVTGNNATSGSFLSADGVSLAPAFQVAETSAWTQGSRVGYGKDADGFVVAWHDTRNDPNAANVYARMVRWNGSAPAFGGPDFKLSDGVSYIEMGPAIGYSETSKVFLVAWHSLPGDDIRARLLSPTGTPIGSEIPVTNDPGWQSDASIAWNPVRDEFLIAYTNSDAKNEVHFNRIKADGTVLGTALPISEAAGTWATQAAFVPALGKYVLAWYEGKLVVESVSQDGVPEGNRFDLAPGFGNYDGFAMAFQPLGGNFGAVFHGANNEDWACAFNADGTQTTPLEVTSSPGDEPNYNPRVAANTKRGEWLLVTSRDYAAVVAQRLGK